MTIESRSEALFENEISSATQTISGTAMSNEPDLSYSFDDESLSSSDIGSTQAFNESIIKLLVLLYQIDGKVTLTEQDYFQDIAENMEWRSGVSISAFINDVIHQTRVAIDQNKAREYLFTLANGLNYDPAQALEYAMDITEVDGNRSDEELELLSLLSNRVLARGLVS